MRAVFFLCIWVWKTAMNHPPRICRVKRVKSNTLLTKSEILHLGIQGSRIPDWSMNFWQQISIIWTVIILFFGLRLLQPSPIHFNTCYMLILWQNLMIREEKPGSLSLFIVFFFFLLLRPGHLCQNSKGAEPAEPRQKSPLIFLAPEITLLNFKTWAIFCGEKSSRINKKMII